MKVRLKFIFIPRGINSKTKPRILTPKEKSITLGTLVRETTSRTSPYPIGGYRFASEAYSTTSFTLSELGQT